MVLFPEWSFFFAAAAAAAALRVAILLLLLQQLLLFVIVCWMGKIVAGSLRLKVAVHDPL